MAQRIQLKRSSIPGKRPDGSYLQAGEVALNTNTVDPGAFFETNTGVIAKIGPNAVSVDAPLTEVGYGPGEGWLDTGNNTFKVYSTAAAKWISAQSPTFSGSTTLIFVGTDFPEASDDLSNDGSARPFATLNRAVIEVGRRSILKNRSDDVFNDKFVIMLLPGDNTVLNDPGISSQDFIAQNADFVANQALPLSTLRTFNPVDGGVLLPRGTSIVGFDLRKTILRPTYKPYWALGAATADIDARTSTVKWSGNSYVSTVTFKDKKSENTVSAIDGGTGEVAILTTLEPHGFRSLVSVDGTITEADTVTLTYPSNVARTYQMPNEVIATTPEGDYLVSPISPTTFTLLNKDSGEALLREQLPEQPGAGTAPAEFIRLTYTNSTHHRLSALSYATKDELNDFYVKIQDAFRVLDFGGAINNGEVTPGETIIVSSVPATPQTSSNDTENASPYAFNISLRSDWGQCGITVNGSKVDGFKSALSSNFTAITLQNDADVYQIYTNGDWVSAKQAYATANTVDLVTVTNAQAMGFITSSADLQNIRFYYKYKRTSSDKTIGLPDELTDTRHYAIKAENSAVVQATSNYSVAAAVGFWSDSGSSMSLCGCTANFGVQSLRAEGFAGINTAGGAIPPDSGFTVLGIRRSANVTKAQLIDVQNHKKVYLTENIAATTTTTITFSQPVDTEALLPYTLKAGSVIWVENITDGTTAKATLAATPLSADRKTINVESADNGIDALAVADMGLPYIRRFVDPRSLTEQSTSLWINNSSSGHRAPSTGDVLRFAETPDPSATSLIATGAQLDPGLTGGWNHVFSVEKSTTAGEGNNPNTDPSNPIVEPTSSEGYYIDVTLRDSYGPWVGNQTTTPSAYLYPRGAVVTNSNRNFRADANQLTSGATELPPSNGNSVWSTGENFELQGLTSDTYISANNYSEAAVDPFKDLYSKTAQYVRGVGINSADYGLENYIDFDNGTTTLGLEGTGTYANYGNPDYFDPAFNNSKSAVTRFLTLLGYASTDIANLLKPQVWSNRNVAVSDFGITLTGEGYALTAGNWPVEFNVQSTILSVGTAWEWAGYLNYTKGLPQYQGSGLPLRQRFDAIVSESWGGQVKASGITETGDSVMIGGSVLDESGRAVRG